MTTANIVRALVVTSLLTALGGARLHAAPPPQAPAPCAAPEFHQFDFWIGDWDTFEIDAKKVVARNRVDLILDGCVLRDDVRHCVPGAQAGPMKKKTSRLVLIRETLRHLD
jgi:hypothetical protein